MSDRKFVRNARRKGVKESTYVRKSWNELQIEKIGATARKIHQAIGTPPRSLWKSRIQSVVGG
jgi:hypothetical protein